MDGLDGAQLVAIIAGLGGLMTGVIGALSAYNTSRSSASKTEMDSLRETIVSLRAENARLGARVLALEEEGKLKDTRIDELEQEIADLRRYIRANGLEVPKKQPKNGSRQQEQEP